MNRLVTTTKDVIVTLENKPGTLSKAAEAISAAGVNILGFSCLSQGQMGTAHFITSDPDKAQAALEKLGIRPTTKEVAFIPVPNRPGELARVSQRLAASGVNIEASFVATGPGGNDLGIALYVNDLSSARKVLGD